MTLEETLRRIVPADRSIEEEAWRRWDSIAKPLRGLGLLEEAVARIAGMTRTVEVDLSRRAVAVFCADNGVVEEGVTQTGQEVTAVVTENLSKGDTSVCKMARVAHADVFPVDIGVKCAVTGENILPRKVAHGTRNMTKGPAMTREETVNNRDTGLSPQARWGSAIRRPAAQWLRSCLDCLRKRSQAGARDFPPRAWRVRGLRSAERLPAMHRTHRMRSMFYKRSVDSIWREWLGRFSAVRLCRCPW